MKNNKLMKIKTIGYKSGNKVYLCKCKFCGSLIPIYASHYYRGSSSCKCKNIASNYPKLYGVWINMKSRCYNDNIPNYHDYGGRGISVCPEWLNDFKAFLNWSLANGYSEDLTLDRIDYNGNYDPNNCRWVTIAEQNRNKRNNIVYGFLGRNYCLKEISRIIGINYKTICSYYYRHGYKATAQKYGLTEVLNND